MNKIYVLGDIHGNIIPIHRLDKEVQLDATDIVILLGDVGLNYYLNKNDIKTKKNFQNFSCKFYCLRGNHEAMAAAAIPDLFNGRQTKEVALWFQNGGDKTWDSIKLLPPQILEHFEKWCGSLDTTMAIINDRNQVVYLDHAGFTLGQENLAEPLWDRSHFWDGWPGDEMYKSYADWDKASNTYLVHGHTPVQYLVQQLTKINHAWGNMINKSWEIKNNVVKPKIINYCNGHKFDIDLGTILSNRIALFNLDTFEVIYLDTD